MNSTNTSNNSLALMAPVTRSWQRVMALPPRMRTVLGVVIAAVLFSAGIFSSMVMQPSWRVLYGHMDPADARGIADDLTTAKIPFDVSPDGTTIRVPADQLDKARLETAAKGGPKSGRLGFELFDKPNWVGSEFDERVNYQRALEGELEHTIESLSSVQSARVHLVLPHDSLYSESQEEAKASVLLKLKQRDLGPREADAIRNLVASAVDHLSPANVTLVDADGRAQLGVKNPDAAENEEEQQLADRLVATLEPIAGFGNVRASVHLDYDMAATDETDEAYDPSSTVTLSMQRSEQENGTHTPSGGVPGTSSNAPNAQKPLLPPPHDAGTASMKEESGTYGASKKTRHIVQGPGRIRRITIAVLLNNRVGAKGATASVPWTQEQVKQITQLAQAAVGYDASRGDVISVENIGFDSEPMERVSLANRAMNAAQSLDLVRYGAALAGLLALILLVIRPVTRSLRTEASLAPGSMISVTDALPEDTPASLGDGEPRPVREAVFQRVAATVKADPSQSARLLHMWIESE